MEKLGMGEPDVLIPDTFKYLYLTDFSLKGNIVFVVLNFINDYIAVILRSFTEIIGIRIIFKELSRIVNFLKGNARIDIFQVENINELTEPELSFVKSKLTDISLEVVKEISLIVNKSLKKISPDDIHSVVLITDPSVFEDVFKEAFSSINSHLVLGEFTTKYSMKFPNTWLNLYKGSLGLVLRGVAGERIKSVSIKKKKD